MNPFKALAQQNKSPTDKPPVYCMVPGCERYVGHGEYARSFADVCFTNRAGFRIELCDRHYCDGLDKTRNSVMAQLLRDPDSIPSRVLAQLHTRDEYDV